ncbi:MAG: hypothetical protein LC663_02840 [Actinobacteria bacterium]|nr:hypothetical protein [Actinomycetota bacterium]
MELRGIRGAILEHKGLAIAVHFRRAADPVETEHLAAPVIGKVADECQLAVIPGRMILELKPPGAGDKGAAVRRVIDDRGLTAALFAGDDVGDLPAFAALDGLDPAIRVAVASPESPPELSALADIVLGSPSEFIELLRKIAQPLRTVR